MYCRTFSSTGFVTSTSVKPFSDTPPQATSPFVSTVRTVVALVVEAVPTGRTARAEVPVPTTRP